MTTERTRKEFKLLDEDINYINTISKEHQLKPSYALSQILAEHKNISNILEGTLKKILLGVNNLNKLSEVQLEIFNSICMKENYQGNDFVSRSEFTSELVSKAYEKAEKKISDNSIKKFSK